MEMYQKSLKGNCLLVCSVLMILVVFTSNSVLGQNLSQTLTKTYSISGYTAAPIPYTITPTHRKVIVDNKIYFLYRDSNDFFITKTNLNGDLIWTKKKTGYVYGYSNLHYVKGALYLVAPTTLGSATAAPLPQWNTLDTATGISTSGSWKSLLFPGTANYTSLSDGVSIIGKNGADFILARVSGQGEINISATFSSAVTFASMYIDRLTLSSAVIYGKTTTGVNYIIKIKDNLNSSLDLHLLKNTSAITVNGLFNSSSGNHNNSHYFNLAGRQSFLKTDTNFTSSIKTYSITKYNGMGSANSQFLMQLYSNNGKVYITDVDTNVTSTNFQKPKMHVLDSNLVPISTVIYPQSSFIFISPQTQYYADFEIAFGKGYLSYRTTDGSTSNLFVFNRLVLNKTDLNGNQVCTSTTNLTYTTIPTSDSLTFSSPVVTFTVIGSIPFGSQVASSITSSTSCLSSVGLANNKIISSELNLKTFSGSSYQIQSNTTILSSIKIYNMEGREVFHSSEIDQNEIALDLSSLSAGIYLIKVKMGYKEEFIKVINTPN